MDTQKVSLTRLLIVEDDKDNAETLAALLAVHGYWVETCGSAQECIRALDAFRPRAVLLDIGLPDVNGYCLAAVIRKMDRFQHLTLIAVTGYCMPEDKERSKQVGINHHLMKPVVLDELIGTLHRVAS